MKILKSNSILLIRKQKNDVVFLEKRHTVIEAVSCGGVVFHRGKVLLLYKNHFGRYTGWVMPKGTMEDGESREETALREVEEETGVKATIIKYIGKTQYSFQGDSDTIRKTVHWFLMNSSSYYSTPQLEEHFKDSGYYKQHEAYHLLKFNDEKQIMRKAFLEYNNYNKSNSLDFTKKTHCGNKSDSNFKRNQKSGVGKNAKQKKK